MQGRRLYLSIMVVAAVAGALVALWFGMRSASAPELVRADPLQESPPSPRETATELVPDPAHTLRALPLPAVAADTTPSAGNPATTSARLTGRVSWPDNSPAVGAEVRARTRPGGDTRRGNVREMEAASTDANGEFEIPSFGGSSFIVEASATPEVATSNQASSQPPTPWLATCASVPLGQRISLVLQAPCDIAGRVIDETGAPVKRFELTAMYLGVSGNPSLAMPRQNRKETFDTTDGSFKFCCLQQGTCFVIAECDGYTTIDQPHQVTLPYPGEPLAITLNRAGTISGQVVDPDGQPVTGAQVAASINGDMNAFALTGNPSIRTWSDESGAFLLERLPPGTFDFTAKHDQWAASEPLSLAVAPFDAIHDVRLVMRVGGTLSGEIHDKHGELAGDRHVSIFELRTVGSYVSRDTRSDASGGFKFDHLTPGPYQLIASSHAEQASAVTQGGDRLRTRDYASDSAPTDFITLSPVQIRDGENTHVVLGVPSESPVRLYGRVTRRGEPVSDVTLRVAHDGSRSSSECSTNDTGQYEITLDAPGAVMIWIGDDSFGASGTEHAVVIPETAAFELDLALPTGSIRGLVLDPAAFRCPRRGWSSPTTKRASSLLGSC